MKSDLISSQALSLSLGNGPLDNQNQGLWQQQLEQASLWQTNLTVKAFKSRYDLPQSGSQQGLSNEISHLQAVHLLSVDNKRGVVPGGVEQIRALPTNNTNLAVPRIADHRGSTVMSDVATTLIQPRGDTNRAVDNFSAAPLSPRVRSLFTQIWQKQHVFLSDIDGMKQLWIRDSTTAKGMTGKLAAGLLGSMSQLGIELNSVVVNGQLIFAKNHGVKE